MPIKVVDTKFKNKFKTLTAESDYSITDIDACIMCAKPVNLQYRGSYVYDYEGEVWCAGCTAVEIGTEKKEGGSLCRGAKDATES